ncbi:MAG: glycogen/starch synthase, partial [Firmicutes bacterium]|nr:glycogen/starch synthase [Bacillota bacterium]
IEYIRGLTGLPDDLFTPDKLEFNKGANMLKGGLVYADYITTVSATYAREIQWAYYGEGLDGLLRARNHQLYGILNGIDYTVYDPSTDTKLFKNYDSKSFADGKAENKTALQKELGLPVDKDKYMVGIISRLTDQKGFDLINCVINEILEDDDLQLVVIGTGEERYENMFKHYAWVYKDRVSANILYSDDLAHKLYAAADSLLIPSAFEPCGLTQLISFRYGTLPIVRETGGLKDTVIPLNEYDNTGDGFSFTNYNAHDMLHVIEYSKEIYYEKPELWRDMIKRGMRKDYSWNTSKEKYMKLYDMMLKKPEPLPEPVKEAPKAEPKEEPKEVLKENTNENTNEVLSENIKEDENA